MSREKIDWLRKNIEAFNRTGELRGGELPPDFEMHQASSIIDTAGVFRGPDSLGDSLGELRGSFEELTFEAERFIEAPGGEIVVLVRARGRGAGSGVEVDNRIAWVWTFRDERPIRLDVYEEQAEALVAVGLR